jgi:hypothetical protein
MVNTFLPVPDFARSAKMLDYRRLGKQRVETLQILRANLGLTKGWVNHPAAKMWKGHETALAMYGIIMCEEWRDRGFKDSCLDKIEALVEEYDLNHVSWPAWLGNEYFHRSHQSNLLRKDPVFYGQYNWEVPDDLDYIWPKPGPIKIIKGNVDKTLYVQDLDEETIKEIIDEKQTDQFSVPMGI